VRLTSRQCEPDRQAIAIDHRMNLAGHPPRDRPMDCFLFRVMQAPC
jgi:hypothetical protein